jgi:hypothetical protein
MYGGSTTMAGTLTVFRLVFDLDAAGKFGKLRKSLWTMLAVMVLALFAPSARADATYTYDVIGTGIVDTSLSWTLDDPNTAVIDVPTSFTTGITLNSSGSFLSGCPPITNVGIDPVAGFVFTYFATSCFQGTFLNVPPTGLVDGTYFLSLDGTTINGTLVVSGVTPGAVPEPSTIALMLIGIGFVLVMEKRIGQGLLGPVERIARC